MNTPLQKAAQAMIDRWESPDWKDTPHTAHYVAELRKALGAEIAQSVEPEVLMVDAAMVEMKNIVPPLRRSECLRLIRAAINATAHPPQPKATTPALRECWYESNELKACRKCGQMHDKAIASQGEKPQATTSAVPEGYVLVPIEATPAMDNAYRKSPCRDLSGLWHEIITAAAQGEKP